MIEAWYPAECRDPKGLLSYYSRHFDTVEVNSTYYALPSADAAAAWAGRTPEGFTFHVKAFAAMTAHRIEPGQLPADLRSGEFPGRDPGVVRECFRRFLEGIEPLRRSGKLGAVLLQYPPGFHAEDRRSWRKSMGWINRSLQVLDTPRVVVEFRHRSWYRERVLEATRRFLSEWGAGLVTVDEPQAGATSVPTVVAPTSELGYFRLHGRNRRNWNRRVPSASERFRYDYSPGELRELAAPIRELARMTEETFVMFNNCHADYAPRNARTMKEILGES